MKSRQRVQLQPAFLLHRRPYRESSSIADFITPDHGRVALVVRGGRGRAARRCLEVFTPLLLSWSARSELGTLTQVEAAAAAHRLGSRDVYSGYYANELILRMVHKGEAVPDLYRAYVSLLEILASGEAVARGLRLFEKRMLDGLGYGPDLTREWRSGLPVVPGQFYRVRPEQGPELVPRGVGGAAVYAGSSLLSLAEEELLDRDSLRDARHLLRISLDYYLEGRPLKTRAVVRSVYAGDHLRRAEGTGSVQTKEQVK